MLPRTISAVFGVAVFAVNFAEARQAKPTTDALAETRSGVYRAHGVCPCRKANPSVNLSLIAFTAWSSFAHAAVIQPSFITSFRAADA
jgi:hypothetical protein